MSTPEHFLYMNKTAILVDGGFFIRRYKSIKGETDPKTLADKLFQMCLAHLKQGNINRELYRIYYYDCFPYGGKQTNPITKKTIDFSQTQIFKFRQEFFEQLKKKRKIALRLGELQTYNNWFITPRVMKEIFNKKRNIESIKEDDIYLDLKQKMVDVKIGLDIATITLKKQADQIILISGDCDFVPASKLARTEGVDFILDPMRSQIKPHLFEHIDGLQTRIKKTSQNTIQKHP
jgi:hypothetical protein